MTSLITRFVGKRILGETISNKFGTDDPYFESVPATRLDGRPNGKMKKRRKALPPGLSDNDAKVLTKVKRRAYRLDMSLFSCCGLRFGWSSVIALLPAIGDVLDALLAMMVLRTCMQVDGGLPASVKSKMMLNIMLDFAVGLVPFLGDLADAAFRANTRNAAVLEKHLRKQGKKNLRQSNLPIPDIDPSDPAEWDRIQGETTPEYVSAPPSRHGTMTTPGNGNTNRNCRENGRTPSNMASPAPAQMRENRSGTGGFMGGRRPAPHDVEMGHPNPNPSPARPNKKSRR